VKREEAADDYRAWKAGVTQRLDACTAASIVPEHVWTKLYIKGLTRSRRRRPPRSTTSICLASAICSASAASRRELRAKPNDVIDPVGLAPHHQRPLFRRRNSRLLPKYSSAPIILFSAVESGGTGQTMPSRSHAGHDASWGKRARSA
jgi:hypothetical protein